jgi:hypothetical protein
MVRKIKKELVEKFKSGEIYFEFFTSDSDSDTYYPKVKESCLRFCKVIEQECSWHINEGYTVGFGHFIKVSVTSRPNGKPFYVTSYEDIYEKQIIECW